MTRYVIAPERSHLWIDARSNVHPIHTSTDGLEGYVDLELAADGRVETSAALEGKLSLSVDKFQSGNRLEDRELHKRIDSRRYPTIVGVLSSVEPDGEDGSYRVGGDVTFRGVSRPHEDRMNITSVDDHTVQLAGSSSFDIREFGMQPPSMLLAKVEPEIDIRVEIVAVNP